MYKKKISGYVNWEKYIIVLFNKNQSMFGLRIEFLTRRGFFFPVFTRVYLYRLFQYIEDYPNILGRIINKINDTRSELGEPIRGGAEKDLPKPEVHREN